MSQANDDTTAKAFDYIVVGGGTAGCALASRLKQNGAGSIAIIDRGLPDYDHELIREPMLAPKLWGSQYQSHYRTTKQPGMADRDVLNIQGNVISGTSAVNYGAWTRGHHTDYDAWAEKVGDDHWAWKNHVEYFKRSEHHFDADGDTDVHGFGGPIWTTSGRSYPLRPTVQKAFLEAGIPDKGGNRDPNDGNGLGLCQWTEAWRDGKRQPSFKAYDMRGIHVETQSFAKRIVFTQSQPPRATGVELVDGRTYSANKELIVSCGAHRTPQLLMLSGIGPAAHLREHNIPVLIDLPGVGQNFSDHPSLGQVFKLRRPEENLAMGGPGWADTPSNLIGIPVEWFATEGAPRDELIEHLRKDGVPDPENHPLVTRERAHYEILCVYAPLGIGEGYNVPINGTHIATGAMVLLPTSRGTVTLASNNVEDQPVIDPQYLVSETDRYIIRRAVRRTMQIVETPELQSIVDGETPPIGFPVISSSSSDEEIDRRVANFAGVWYHASGTAAMGSVLDTNLKVKGVEGLRVCDASVYPDPIGAHYQAPTYALAEHTADLILEKA